jgi:hypothetical protein
MSNSDTLENEPIMRIFSLLSVDKSGKTKSLLELDGSLPELYHQLKSNWG